MKNQNLKISVKINYERRTKKFHICKIKSSNYNLNDKTLREI